MTTNKIALSEEFKQYESLFKKHNLFLSDLSTLEANYIISMTEEHFEKLGRKNYPKQPTTSNTQVITARSYACYISSINFFHDKVINNYTSFGFKPYKLTCQNPDSTLKIVRTFHFEYNR